MNNLSLDPDPHLRWIYDYTHPDYNSTYAADLRERRRRAISNAPGWMVRQAQWNDAIRRANSEGDRK